MFGTALKSLWARRLRLALSAVAVVLGTAFVAGSLMFTTLLSSFVDSLVGSATGDVNVYSTEASVAAVELPGAGPQPLGDIDVARVRDTPGVSRVEPIVASSAVYALNSEGNVLSFGQAPGVATNFHDAPAMNGGIGPRLIEGRAPAADGEVALDPATFARSGHQLGDQISISTPYDGVQSFELVGLAAYGTGGTGGISYLFFTTADMQRIALDGQPKFTGLWIVTEPGAADGVVEQIAQVVPSGYSVLTGAEVAESTRESLESGLGFIGVFLLTFAGISLLVASLLIFNTFSILVAQRARELALLRAIGATRHQVLAATLSEAAVVGAAGATLGIALGYGLVWALLGVLRLVGMDPAGLAPELTLPAALAAYGLGIGITVLAAGWPAWRASATRPVEALGNAAEPKPARRLPMVGVAFIELGVAAIICAVWIPVPHELVWLGIGATLLLLGATLAATTLGGPVISLLTRLFTRLFGDLGRWAGLNATRQPGRTGATAATLMIALALVTAVAILADSTTASIRASAAANQRGDFMFNSVTGQTFDARVAEEAEQVDGVAAAHALWVGAARLDGATVRLSGATKEAVERATALDVAGELYSEGAEPAIISDELAAAGDYQLGQLLALHSLAGELTEVRVSGIYPYDSTFGDVIVEPDAFAALSDGQLVRQVIVEVDDGADLAAVRAGLEAVAQTRPTVALADVNEYLQARVDRFSQLFVLLYALLGLAIVISVLGIVNTMSLSVTERTREVGLLRAVGLTRAQLRLLIRLEAVIVAVLGALLGAVIGLVCGAALVHLLAGQGIDQLRVPWLALLGFMVTAGAVGVLAAVWPARRAARLNVLDAIAEL